ncbi:tRNA sulfurtransferase [Pseudomonas savastanoi pv. glycinea]|uniref:tRNA sulfurtransferase n=20 Tax=Pseudomonas syringae group TaxID=136849 RepID=A0A0N8T242_PSEAJ|nr:tRNA sulfurtransferase [Pseudomonas syringae pv. broussonetiae]KPX34852.1 tRNA sulfurtransferase [Pseudomonas ficuserectae]KPX95639.1 tRNA sU8 sulfurtransferase [Pseudomonas amygdali pv. mori]KPY58161.1 tRNA sU8 sulfurtransferase [Pseudomonas amygdali pv. sesami]KPY81744.1 tRNA sU8 sulfurtransferase [Pseudomonas amygdali pv. tabaci]RML90017.1 tRNA sulfurtransferase [Pseudomonas savastanoi pv. glycinea]RMN55944.1 tRNA sulfurtransferase [Pseudomonas amygdali pv. hibisci]RMO22575.1 tRNA sulf
MSNFRYNPRPPFSVGTSRAVSMKLIVKVFPEITIKSPPVRKKFIRQLGKNIRTVLRELDADIVVGGVWDNLEVETRQTDPKVLQGIRDRLSCMPGIANFLQVAEYPLGDMDDIVAKCKLHYADLLPGKMFSVRCKRAGRHDFSSMDVEKYVGSKLRMQCGAAGIELKKPDLVVRMEIRDQRLFVVHDQHQGMGGYPLGALEQTLVLMSGGFDSTVAAYQIMRRGLMAHFCFFNLGGRAHELGVMEVAHFIWKKYGSSQRVLFVSVPFEEVLGEILQKVDNSHMGVVLKRMMLRAASAVADRLEIDVLVTGEAISQVASQTLPNLSLIDAATDKLVLRPLVASHKQDIVDLATEIGTADFARHMPEYCGVISVNPKTNAKRNRVEYEEKQFDMAILEQALERAKLISIDRVIDDLSRNVDIEEVSQALAGQVIIDIRHPDAQEDQPLQVPGVEIQTLPFYALNSRFKALDDTRQYLLYCDKGVMSRLHAHHLLSEGHANVRVYRPS